MDHGVIERFTPLDACNDTLAAATVMLRDRYPGLAVEPLVGDVNVDLHRLPTDGTRMVALLGGGQSATSTSRSAPHSWER